MRKILLGFGVATALSACGDPLRDFARLSDVSVAEGAATVTQTPVEATNTGGGLFSRLLKRRADDPTNSAVQAALEETAPAPETPSQTATQASTVAVEQSEDVAAPRRGLFGLFGGGGANPPAPRTGPDRQEVTAGTVMPFGQIARVCGVRGAQFGTQIEAGAGYRLFDTIPNSTAPRPFYITGFDDNCARTFTGAVVVTGDVETHEFVRYRPSNESIGYTSTDNAYEALKASVCRVGRGQPCGSNTRRLNRDTQFITVYNSFGGTFSAVPTQWAQILVNDGNVLSMAIKDDQ